MRYIQKGEEPAYMSEWKELRKSCGQKLVYKEFDQKAQLNKDLRKEQHNICCYCQRVIDHYQMESGKIATAAHNEHLYPENVKNDPKSEELQMDYGNIFACCVDSRGYSKREKHLRHCGESKENQIIPSLIKQPDCADYFHYALTGKIEVDSSLEGKNIEVVARCIDVLNLNCPTLVDDRKICMDGALLVYGKKSLQDLERIREQLLASASYPAYIELRLQVIDHLIKTRLENDRE